jgi:hypothetical protein
MNYRGVIIEESLGNKDVLKEVSIKETQVEKATEEYKTPWVSQWTLHSVEIPEDRAKEIAQKLSKSFDPEHPDWYADFKNDSHHYIIFQNKVFKIDRSTPEQYQEAVQHGLSRGIPEYQLDFSPDIKQWERENE